MKAYHVCLFYPGRSPKNCEAFNCTLAASSSHHTLAHISRLFMMTPRGRPEWTQGYPRIRAEKKNTHTQVNWAVGVVCQLATTTKHGVDRFSHITPCTTRRTPYYYPPPHLTPLIHRAKPTSNPSPRRKCL